MAEVSRRSGVSLVRLFGSEPLANDAAAYLVRPGEWFALVQRPATMLQATRYGIAKISKSGKSEVRWYSGAGCLNIHALYMYAALENEKSSSWTL